MKTIKIKLSTGIIEVERKLHTEMDRFSRIKIPKGFRLLTLGEFLEIWNNHKDKLDYGKKFPDEVVEQPIKENKEKYPYWNVWFASLSGRSDLYGRFLDYNYRVRGVRFVKLNKEKN